MRCGPSRHLPPAETQLGTLQRSSRAVHNHCIITSSLRSEPSAVVNGISNTPALAFCAQRSKVTCRDSRFRWRGRRASSASVTCYELSGPYVKAS